MSTFFSRLLRQSGIYALGNLLLKLSGLLVVPVYLHVLSGAEYGYFALLDATARVVILVAGLGLATGVMRFLTQAATEEEQAAVPFTALVVSAAAGLAACALCWAFAAPLAALLTDAPERADLVRWLGVYAAFKVVEAIPTMLLRTQERAGLYVTAALAETLLLVGSVLVLLLGFDRGLRGVVEAYAFSAGVGATVLVAAMLVRVPAVFDARLVRPLVGFGAPLVLAGLAGLFLNLGDRYLLKALADAATVGIYDWSARLAGALNMLVVQSFQLAFGVLGLKTLGGTDDGRPVYRRTFRHFVLWAGWAVLGLSLLAYDVTRLAADDAAYLAAETLVLPIALGFMLYGVYVVVINVLYAASNTRTIAAVVFGAAVLNAALNVVLIPVLGAWGAAAATALAYGVLTAVTARAAERQYPVGYPWGVLGAVLLLVVGLYLGARPTLDWSPWGRLAARMALIAAYWPLVLALRLYRVDEIRAGLDRLRRGRAARGGNAP